MSALILALTATGGVRDAYGDISVVIRNLERGTYLGEWLAALKCAGLAICSVEGGWWIGAR